MEMLVGKTPYPALEVSGPPDPIKTDYPVSRPENTRPPIKLKEMGPTSAGEEIYLTSVLPLTYFISTLAPLSDSNKV